MKPVTSGAGYILSPEDSKRKKWSMEKKKALWGWIFVTPALIFFTVFSFYPIFNAFYMSLTKKSLLSLKPPELIWLKNYRYLLHSPDFWNSMKATSFFTLGTFLLLLVVSLMLGALIVTRKRFKRLFQMVFYSPALLSSVVAALIWLLIFDPRGLANQFINFLAQTPGTDHNWLASANMLGLATIIVYFWKYIGYFTIIFVAGMGSIPKSIHEAAEIDGASRQDFTIVLP